MPDIKTEIAIRMVNKSGNKAPAYETSRSAGMDLRAHVQDTLVLKPGARMLIPTGLYMQIPEGFEGQVRPRSGLAVKKGVTVLNSPGTIDADYRGEVKVILINHGDEDFEISHGDRIAQLVICKHERIRWIETNKLEETERGTGGFGSTGI